MKIFTLTLVFLLSLYLITPTYIQSAVKGQDPTNQDSGGIPFYVWIFLGAAVGAFAIHSATTSGEEDEEGTEITEGEYDMSSENGERIDEDDIDESKVIVIE